MQDTAADKFKIKKTSFLDIKLNPQKEQSDNKRLTTKQESKKAKTETEKTLDSKTKNNLKGTDSNKQMNKGAFA